MQVRLKKSWGQWSKGHIFTDMPGGQARTLIARNIAEELPAAKAKSMTSPVDRMMRSGRDLKIKAYAGRAAN
jgi:hypothetical protein